MAKKGLKGHLPDGWGDWPQEKKEEWLSYPDPWKEREKKRKKKGTMGGLKPWGYR